MDETDDDARKSQARPLSAARLAAACLSCHAAGADGEDGAEITRVRSKYARNGQSYDCSNGRSVVEWVSDEDKAGAGDDGGQEQEQGVGARLLSVLDGARRYSKEHHEGYAARPRERFDAGRDSDRKDPEYRARQSGNKIGLTEGRRPKSQQQVIEWRMDV